jgi:hypothetical protein
MENIILNPKPNDYYEPYFFRRLNTSAVQYDAISAAVLGLFFRFTSS